MHKPQLETHVKIASSLGNSTCGMHDFLAHEKWVIASIVGKVQWLKCITISFGQRQGPIHYKRSPSQSIGTFLA